MKFPIITQKEPWLQALPMDEYVDFVEFSLQDADLERARKQKMCEECITTPFSFPKRKDGLSQSHKDH